LKYDEVLSHPEMIENHIVLVGTMTEEQDMHLTPLGKMSGLMIQAYSLNTILQQNSIIHIPWYIEWLVCFIICWLLQLLMTALTLYATKYEKNGIVYFFKKANLFSGALFVVWMVFTNYILYICFSKYHLVLDATMLFAIMVILLEAREMYEAIINAFAKKHHWEWTENSLFLES
jgi:CHASE2 domain-containing sensor protein